MPVFIEQLSREAGQAESDALEAIVWPPEIATTWVGKDLVWSDADRHFFVRGTKGGPLLAKVEAFSREVEWDGQPLRIGGIGGVMTHPDHRKQGHARAALQQALAYLHEEAQVAFALLFLEAFNIPFYERQGWREFRGEVLVQQTGGIRPLTVLRAMTLGVRNPDAPTRGKIDLRGLPW